jgi:WD repeat-containing protein 35
LECAKKHVKRILRYLSRSESKFHSNFLFNYLFLFYFKTQNVKAAVDVCVKLNQWDEGVRLAKQYNIGQVDSLLARKAQDFIDQNKIFNAIELYRKARHFLDAARHMFDVSEKESKNRNSPLLIKKMFVLTGLLVEQYRDMMKTGGLVTSKAGTSNRLAQRDQASKALDGILSEEAQIAIRDSKIIDNAWRPAEAYHFKMLCERQLRDGKIDAAFKTSMALMEYEDILEPKHVYSLIGKILFFNCFLKVFIFNLHFYI